MTTKSITYPFTPGDHGSRTVEMTADNLFGFSDSRATHPTASPYNAGGGGMFTLNPNETITMPVTIPEGHILLITRSSTFGGTPKSDLVVTPEPNKGRDLGPGESIKMTQSGTLSLYTAAGGTFCVQVNHS